MNILRFTLLWVSVPFLLPAQSDFLKDPDIVWAVEIQQDWVVDGSSLEEEERAGIYTLKRLCETPDDIFSNAQTLSSLVSSAVAAGKISIFKDPECRNPTSWETVLGYTEVLTFDPDTYEDTIVKVWNDFDPDLLKMWRLRQVLAFHQKSNRWTTTVESIAPLIVIINAEGDSVDTKPIFWFKPFDKRQKLDSKQVVWAKRTLNKSVKTQLPFDTLKPIKQHKNFPGLLPIFESIALKHPEIPLHHGTENQLIPLEDRDQLIVATDTGPVCFAPRDPDIGAFQVVSFNKLAQVQSLRLVQTWYWDTKRNQLSICLDAIAPLRHVLNEDGALRFMAPLYYQKVKN